MEYALTITGRECAELLPAERLPPPAEDNVLIRGRFSLVSPGTELAHNWRGERFPNFPGYAVVGEVEAVGPKACGFKPGDVVFAPGAHRSQVCFPATYVHLVPTGLASENAVLARLAKVPLPAILSSCARPGDPVLVTGLGPVGFMAAQVARIAGFDVTVCDPDPVRLKMARDHGLSQAAAGLSEPGLCDNFALVLECSGGKRTTTYTLFSNFFSNVMSRSAAVGSIVIWIKATSGIRTARGRVWIVACAGWRKGVSRLAVSPGPFRQKWARKYT